MRNYTKIEAWKLADDLAVTVYQLTRWFPKEEIYGLTSQLHDLHTRRRQILSKAQLDSKKDYLYFLYITRGSLSESIYFIHLARRLECLLVDDANQLQTQANSAIACLQGLIRAVEKEVGRFGRVAAKVTSFIAVATIHWSMVQGR